MSIRKVVFSLSLALPLALAGCPTTEGEGSDIFPCSTNADCNADSEICHTIGKICVPTCTDASDCPDNQNECAVLKDAAGNALTTELVCQCKTGDAAFCTSEDTAVTLVCSTVDNVCETKCSTNDDCAAFSPARECNAAGICVGAAVCSATSCTDPSLSKCGADSKCAACTADEDCNHIAGGKTHCNAGVCEVPACNPANLVPGTSNGPDICAYAQTCTGGACVDIATPSCTTASSHNSSNWDKSKQGPVIVSVTTRTFSSDVDVCASGGGKEMTIKYYAPKGITFTTSAATQGNRIRVLNASGVESASWIVMNTTVPSGDSKEGTILAGSCGSSTISNWAVFLKDEESNVGNAVCLQ